MAKLYQGRFQVCSVIYIVMLRASAHDSALQSPEVYILIIFISGVKWTKKHKKRNVFILCELKFLDDVD